mmetsp:Transcript_112999/g.221541  ORF Transcript_112999/g.221541 Transcript_112999/m.221541 type:complete len:145 (+) Transcript_112999:1-435(+)
MVIDANVLPPVIALASDTDSKIRLEALWVLSNIATEGSLESVELIFREGCINPLISCFERRLDRELARGVNGICGVLKAGDKRAGDLGENPYAVEILRAHGLDWTEDVELEDPELRGQLEFIVETLTEARGRENHEKASDSDCN